MDSLPWNTFRWANNGIGSHHKKEKKKKSFGQSKNVTLEIFFWLFFAEKNILFGCQMLQEVFLSMESFHLLLNDTRKKSSDADPIFEMAREIFLSGITFTFFCCPHAAFVKFDPFQTHWEKGAFDLYQISRKVLQSPLQNVFFSSSDRFSEYYPCKKRSFSDLKWII